MVLSDYTKQWKRYKIPSIVECVVLEDGIRVSRIDKLSHDLCHEGGKKEGVYPYQGSFINIEEY